MAKRAKAAGSAKRDLTGKKAGKKSKADLKAVAASINVADKKKILVEARNEMAAIKAQNELLVARRRSIREKVEGIGLSKASFDLAVKLNDMAPEDRGDYLDSLNISLEAFGLGRQDDLFAAVAEGSNDAFDQNDNADRAGFQAASEGQNFDMNPHAPETPEHEAWSAGWMRQQRQHAVSLGPDSATAH